MNWKFYNPAFEYEQMYIDLGGPWFGHKYFAYDLIRNLKPKKIVELGTHLGCSLFSFTQAVKDGKLLSQLDAIDTWQGDKHAGKYDQKVFNRVTEIKKTYYSKININLVRKTFDEASNNYTDNSIDILHIDGLHTYQMVKHDYQTWFNKVKKNGVILMHDVSVRKWNFGVYKLFNEIQKSYKTIKFEHSFGLGVIFKDKQIYKKLEEIVLYLQQYYLLKAEKSQYQWDLNKQVQKVNEYERWIKQQVQKVNEYERWIKQIKSSRTYKFWQTYCKIRDLLRSQGKLIAEGNLKEVSYPILSHLTGFFNRSYQSVSKKYQKE